VSRPRLLDLFCCQGGAGMGYSRTGFDVLGIDVEPQPRYPFPFHCDDAIHALEDYLEFGGGFAAIHASPPCQAHSNMRHLSTNEHPDLVARTRELLKDTGLPYVIENVIGAPLVNPVQLCGSSFGLGVQRHRLFECSFPVMAPPCAHGQQEKRYRVFQRGEWYLSPVAHVWGRGGGKAMGEWPEAMGIDWMDSAGLAQAVPPAMTEHIGGYLMAHLNARAAA
jgi:DNA (cytosine-5)-methyltransferase 1